MNIDDRNIANNPSVESEGDKDACLEKLTKLQSVFDGHCYHITHEIRSDYVIAGLLKNSLLTQEQFQEACQRTIVSTGMTFRGAISKDVSRAERRQLDTFEIDWSDTPVEGVWSAGGVVPDSIDPVDIRSAIGFSARVAGGLDGVLCDEVSNKLFDLLRTGELLIPRLKPVATTNDTTQFEWQKIFVES